MMMTFLRGVIKHNKAAADCHSGERLTRLKIAAGEITLVRSQKKKKKGGYQSSQSSRCLSATKLPWRRLGQNFKNVQQDEKRKKKGGGVRGLLWMPQS